MTKAATTTSEAILRTADVLFGERGFAATSTRDIAAASGTNLALLHHHFHSKAGLHRAVLDAHFGRLLEALGSALAIDGSPRERVHRVLDAYVAFLVQHRGFCMMVQREATDPARSAHLREWMGPLFRAAEQLVHLGWPASREGSLSAAELLVSVYGLIVTHVIHADLVADLEARTSAEAAGARSRHLHAIVDLLLDRLEATD